MARRAVPGAASAPCAYRTGRRFVAGRPDVLPMLGAMREGHRNAALFDVVRWWSYAQDRGTVLRDWRRIVLDYAMQRNQEFPLPLPTNPNAKDGPLPDDEVAHLAHSISTRTWKATGAVDHSPPAQRRRALKGGVVRRAENRPRDRAILQDRIEGMSERALADKHGLTRSGVQHILKRDAALLGGSR